ncbi:MAG: hypothetical protein ACJAS4_001058 [Bacteriovoracaceae bacterium]|jgi:hypothetical protein
MKKTLLILIFLVPFAHAEYRVFQYIVKNKITSAKDQPNSHMVISTLNPVSYIAYHGGSSLINIDLMRTWICPGHTGQKLKICQSPYANAIVETAQ